MTLEGIEGVEKIKTIMETLRKNPPSTVAGKKILAVRDYQTSVRTEVATGKTDKILLPTSNVIYLELEDDNNFVIRPSGTEPKIKLYCLLKGDTQEDAEKLAELVKEDIKNIVK